MLIDKHYDLGHVARKISGLQAVMKIHHQMKRVRNSELRGERWIYVRDWAADCWQQLTRVMQGFYPKRLVRRLQRVLRRVDGAVRKGLEANPVPVKGTYMRKVMVGGSQVVRQSDEEGIFARLMAIPRAEGQLLC